MIGTMERVEVEVYSWASNHAIVRVPGRHFPGIVIQGDTLSTLVHDAEEIASGVRDGGSPLDAAEALADRLSELLAHYARSLTEHGIRLPFVAPEG